MKVESVKINTAVLNKIRTYCKGSGRTITGYINIVLGNQIDADIAAAKEIEGWAKSQIKKKATR